MTQTRFRWIAMATLLLAAFMQLLDVTIVNVAIPSLQHDLGMTYATVQWIAAGYTLAFAVGLVAGGRLGDIFGRKRIFIIGMFAFTIFSLLCGLAQNSEQLIAFRLLQGLSSAMMMPQVLAYLVVLFTDHKERLIATGMYGGIAGIATVGGPIIGGLLLEHNLWGLDWRTIFLINVPVGAVSLLLAARFIPESKSPHPLRVDWIGMAILTVALLLLLYPLIQGRELDWPWWTFAMMAGSLPLLVLFWLYERYKTKKDGSPLLVLDLFKERVFNAGLIIFIFFFGAMGAYFLLSTIFMQNGLGFTPLQAGLANVPFSVGIGLGVGVLSNVLLPKIGRRVLSLGALLLIAGFSTWIITLTMYGTAITGTHMIPATFISGLGMGVLIASLFNFVLSGIDHSHAGSASGVLSTMQEIGTSLGIAVLGVLFFNLIGSNAGPTAKQVEPHIREQLNALHLPASMQQTIIHDFTVCYTDRANAKNPDDTPASCQQLAANPQLPALMGQKITETLQTAATDATKENFLITFRETLLYQIALLVVVLALIPMLPKKVSAEPVAG